MIHNRSKKESGQKQEKRQEQRQEQKKTCTNTRNKLDCLGFISLLCFQKGRPLLKYGNRTQACSQDAWEQKGYYNNQYVTWRNGFDATVLLGFDKTLSIVTRSLHQNATYNCSRTLGHISRSVSCIHHDLDCWSRKDIADGDPKCSFRLSNHCASRTILGTLRVPKKIHRPSPLPPPQGTTSWTFPQSTGWIAQGVKCSDLTLFRTCGKQPRGPSRTMSDSGIRHRSTSPEARVAARWKKNKKQKTQDKMKTVVTTRRQQG